MSTPSSSSTWAWPRLLPLHAEHTHVHKKRVKMIKPAHAPSHNNQVARNQDNSRPARLIALTSSWIWAKGEAEAELKEEDEREAHRGCLRHPCEVAREAASPTRRLCVRPE